MRMMGVRHVGMGMVFAFVTVPVTVRASGHWIVAASMVPVVVTVRMPTLGLSRGAEGALRQ